MIYRMSLYIGENQEERRYKSVEDFLEDVSKETNEHIDNYWVIIKYNRPYGVTTCYIKRL